MFVASKIFRKFLFAGQNEKAAKLPEIILAKF